MKKNNEQNFSDNRMEWIRNFEKLKRNRNNNYYTEYEIGSECRISGVLNFMTKSVLCGLLTTQPQNGLYSYLLKIKYAGIESYDKKANKKGYFFKDSIIGEFLCLFSLYFRCRFYLISTTDGELTDTNLKVKWNHNFVRRQCDHHIHPQIFLNRGKKFSDIELTEFLHSVKFLDAKYHQQFILACYHYAKALKEVGLDSEMVFIRLVSAIEALSRFIELKPKDDPLKEKDFESLIRKDIKLSKEERDGLKKIFKNRNSKKKFIKFIKKYSKGSFSSRSYKGLNLLKIKKSDLPKVLGAIYDARSAYLHNGEPMYLSRPMSGYEKYDTDPSFGMIIDKRTISGKKKLPYTYFFENIVRKCLLNFLKDNQNEENQR